MRFYSLFFLLLKLNNFWKVGMKKRKRNYSVAEIIPFVIYLSKFRFFDFFKLHVFFFYCKSALLLLFDRKLTEFFNVHHWVYPFWVTLKVRSLCLLPKSFLFFINTFTFKNFKIFFRIHDESDKAGVVDMFYLVITNFLFQFSISCVKLFPTFVGSVRSI